MYTEEFDVPGRAGSATGAANKTSTKIYLYISCTNSRTISEIGYLIVGFLGSKFKCM